MPQSIPQFTPQPSVQKIPVTELTEPALPTPVPPLPGSGKFHVRLIEGFYQNLRRAISWPLIVLFFALAWVRIDGQPLILFDFASHRIFLFGSSLSWYDLPLLAGLLIAGASLLFFMAVAWGRIWCGFACPQSIWTWIFIRIEQLTEGRAALRAKQEGQPFTAKRLLLRSLKHLLWLLVALCTAVSFSGYFVPLEQLVPQLLRGELSLFSLSWIVIMTLLTYFNAGLVREKVCLHMCPYSRFQGVMFDQNTRTVSYDRTRGEPRRHRQSETLRKSEALSQSTSSQAVGAGDCVDCGICVQVCPTGIDIRDGLQAACIDCAACIDACDAVMLKLGRAPGLIGFYSEQQLQGGLTQTAENTRSEQPQTFLRPRLLGYFAVLLVTLAALLYGFSSRSELLIEIARERGQLYQLQQGLVCNRYRIELETFTEQLPELNLAVQAANPALKLQLEGPAVLKLTDGHAEQYYRLCAAAGGLPSGSNRIDFSFRHKAFVASKQSTFLAP